MQTPDRLHCTPEALRKGTPGASPLRNRVWSGNSRNSSTLGGRLLNRTAGVRVNTAGGRSASEAYLKTEGDTVGVSGGVEMFGPVETEGAEEITKRLGRTVPVLNLTDKFHPKPEDTALIGVRKEQTKAQISALIQISKDAAIGGHRPCGRRRKGQKERVLPPRPPSQLEKALEKQSLERRMTNSKDLQKEMEAYNVPLSKFEEELFLKYLKFKRGITDEVPSPN